MSGLFMLRCVESGELRELAIDHTRSIRMRRAGGGRGKLRAPAGAREFLDLFTQVITNWRPPGERRKRYTGVQISAAQIGRMVGISVRQWQRPGGALAWLEHHQLVTRLPTTEATSEAWRQVKGKRNLNVREGTPIYVPGDALVQALRLRVHRIDRRLRRVAKRLRTQSSGVFLCTEKPSALSGSAVRESDLLLTKLQRATPWRTKVSRRARRQKSIERKKRHEGGGPAGASVEPERSQRAPVAPGDAIATSEASAPAAPADVTQEPAERFAAPMPVAEIRSAIGAAPSPLDAGVAPMPIGADGTSQRLGFATVPTSLADILSGFRR